ncbi:hypothetical protein FHG87_000348 [Trinorchestia longiramus]|nr:hypothetical protein FHG87_000348 [Trinorchestia longiramus]
MFAKVRTSHLQHKEDSMLATVKGELWRDKLEQVAIAARGANHFMLELKRSIRRSNSIHMTWHARGRERRLGYDRPLSSERRIENKSYSSVSQSGPYCPPGGVEEMQGGGRRVRLEWGSYITV